MDFKLDYADIAILFFLTLGPLKAIPPFARLTHGAEPAFRRAMAWQSTLIATVVVLGVALLGSFVLTNWHVSPPAIAITGGIILFYQALRIIMQTPTGAPASADPPARPPQPSPAIAFFPLAIPALVTAPGIAAIAAVIVLNRHDLAHEAIIVVLLLAVMALNLLALWNTEAIVERVSPGVFYLIGWVLSVLQASLAVQIVIHSLRVLDILRWPASPG